jgi:hypothetical protein
MEELEPTNICTYRLNNPAFETNRVQLRRLFFINEYHTKYISVGSFPARDYLTLVEFVILRKGGCPKTLILRDEQVDALAETLPKLRKDMCSCEAGGRRCENGAFRLDVTRSRRIARLYVDSHYISLTLQDIDYLSRMFNIVQQQFRDYFVHLKMCCPMLQPL